MGVSAKGGRERPRALARGGSLGAGTRLKVLLHRRVGDSRDYEDSRDYYQL